MAANSDSIWFRSASKGLRKSDVPAWFVRLMRSIRFSSRFSSSLILGLFAIFHLMDSMLIVQLPWWWIEKVDPRDWGWKHVKPRMGHVCVPRLSNRSHLIIEIGHATNSTLNWCWLRLISWCSTHLKGAAVPMPYQKWWIVFNWLRFSFLKPRYLRKLSALRFARTDD